MSPSARSGSASQACGSISTIKYVYQIGDRESVGWLELMDVVNAHYGPQYRVDLPVEERHLGALRRQAVKWRYKRLDRTSIRTAVSGFGGWLADFMNTDCRSGRRTSAYEAVLNRSYRQIFEERCTTIQGWCSEEVWSEWRLLEANDEHIGDTFETAMMTMTTMMMMMMMLHCEKYFDMWDLAEYSDVHEERKSERTSNPRDVLRRARPWQHQVPADVPLPRLLDLSAELRWPPSAP